MLQLFFEETAKIFFYSKNLLYTRYAELGMEITIKKTDTILFFVSVFKYSENSIISSPFSLFHYHTE